MQTAHRSFAHLTAADLMTAPVMTIPQDMSLREAARLLHRSNISGAPVMDSEGRCLGVLSSTDFVTWAEEGGETREETEKGEATTFIAPWGELISLDEAADSEIRHYMTADPVTVAPTCSIGELAEKMVDAHIHRILVVDQGKPCGIVTSTDILAAVARATRR
jgi:CBS domain-containing protein